MWTPTPCHCAGKDSYRQRSDDDDQGGDVGLVVGILGVIVSIDKVDHHAHAAPGLGLRSCPCEQTSKVPGTPSPRWLRANEQCEQRVGRDFARLLAA